MKLLSANRGTQSIRGHERQVNNNQVCEPRFGGLGSSKRVAGELPSTMV